MRWTTASAGVMFRPACRAGDASPTAGGSEPTLSGMISVAARRCETAAACETVDALKAKAEQARALSFFFFILSLPSCAHLYRAGVPVVGLTVRRLFTYC